LMFKGVPQCTPTVVIFYFGPFKSFHYSPLPLYFPNPIFQQHSIQTLISSTFTDHMSYNFTDTLSFSLHFPLSSGSIEQFYIFYQHVLHMSLYMIMLVYVCVCIYIYIYIHIYICYICTYIYMYIYIYMLYNPIFSSMYARKHAAFVFLSQAYFT
jgi:hypothetical protein